jgi:hypothetical protein
VINWALSPREIQVAQMVVGVAAAIFVGLRFLPPRYRQRVGIVLTAGYLIGFVAFMIYAMMR